MTDPKDKDTAALTADDSSPEEDLDAIMQELEAIDQEAEQQPSAAKSEATPSVAAPEASKSEVTTEVVEASVPAVEDAPQEKMTPVAPDVNSAPTQDLESNVTPISRSTAPAPKAEAGGQALTMKLSGSMTLELEFESGGRTVTLVCDDDALVCRFGDGTEVRIPAENAKGNPLKRLA